MAEVQVRFRHTGGDVGPFRFPASSNVQDMRETLFQEWPKDGILGKDYPASPGEVRIILNGRFLEAGESLQELRSAMGSPKPGALVTMHVVLRPASSMKSTASKVGKEEQAGCCACVVQ